MCEVLRLDRLVDRTPWGFRLTGGYDFGTPLSVVKVTGDSIAANSGVQVGDIILEINGQSTKHFIHTDAQNFIGISGNHLTLTIIRGSLITPTVTPMRGMTPMINIEDENNAQVDFNANLLNERLEKTINAEYEDEICDGLKDAPLLHVNAGIRPEITKNIQKRQEGDEMNNDVSELELDELLTGNEEVLDEGVLGINFKKYMPQVDFIRESEVFKFLQNENTKKEIPEEVQLQKEPTKRFSTFLQKPKPPPPKPQGPLWHYPKAPNYLPREVPKEPEEPRRRPKRDSCHTVLWLFLEESGEHVVDERWGSREEEIINLSRCEMREDDTISLTSSMATGQSGRDSRLDKHEETVSSVSELTETKFKNNENHLDQMEQSADQNAEHTSMQIAEVETELDHEINEVTTREQTCEEVTEGNELYSEQYTTSQKEESNKEIFSQQIADIQAQISALEIQAPSDLQTQLNAIQEQLSKIVDVKTAHVTAERKTNIGARSNRKEYYTDENTRVEEEEKCLAEQSEDYYEYTFECEATINNGKRSTNGSNASSGRSSPDNSNGYEADINKDESNNDSDNEYIESFKGDEYEICEAPPLQPTRTKKAHPLTPQMRPIVLPGGRMWRQPKDACHDDFYQGVLVTQAEVMIGNTGGVNFTKYVPPKFDMSQSPVCKLIHEIEDRTKTMSEKEKELPYYNTPIGKRHFYAATLREPDPIGGIDLQL